MRRPILLWRITTATSTCMPPSARMCWWQPVKRPRDLLEPYAL
ncbi:MAG TPA: hypothetical protein VF099_18585 [Ktedonobacterales bacterium]